MTLNHHHVSPKEYFKCELESLKFFKNNFFFTQSLEQLASDASQHHSKYSNKAKIETFNFESNFKIIIDGNIGIAHVGVFLKTKNCGTEFDNISYCCTIIEEKKILRKFHFDFTPHDEEREKKRRQPHPRFHLQYAGNLTGHLEGLEVEDKHLDTWLSEPRLFYFPMSLALLVNLILVEFPEERTKRLYETPEWRNMISKNEKLILKPFFEKCHSFFQKSDSNLFSNDFCYGN